MERLELQVSFPRVSGRLPTWTSDGSSKAGRTRIVIQIAGDLASAWRSSLSWIAQFQLKTNQEVEGDSGRPAARAHAWRLNGLILIHFCHSALVSTAFLLVPPLSTVTTVALKLGTIILFTLVLSFSVSPAFLALAVFASPAFATVHSVDFHWRFSR